jgi:3-phosphoshikimate 1-carboxyvinyltransferase
VEVEGPFRLREADLDATLTSQGVTGLLLALAAAGGGLLRVRGLVSAPYVDLTRAALAVAGVRVEILPDGFLVPEGQALRPFSARVEGDWSGAAFPLVAAAIGGEVTALGLDPAGLQADRAVLDALRAAGARVVLGHGRVRVSAGDLRPFDFDLTHRPDLGPPLAVLAAACPGTSRLLGSGRLRAKESDRAAALCAEFGRLGLRIEVSGDALCIHGGPVGGGRVSARGDHRIAMALGVLALRAEERVLLESSRVVDKSWPGFWRTLARLRRRPRPHQR